MARVGRLDRVHRQRADRVDAELVERVPLGLDRRALVDRYCHASSFGGAAALFKRRRLLRRCRPTRGSGGRSRRPPPPRDPAILPVGQRVPEGGPADREADEAGHGGGGRPATARTFMSSSPRPRTMQPTCRGRRAARRRRPSRSPRGGRAPRSSRRRPRCRRPATRGSPAPSGSGRSSRS